MAQDTTPALVLYVGNGIQTEFEVPFDKGSFGEIKVAFVRRGLTDYTYDPDTYNVKGYLYAWNGGVYTKTETPDTDTPLYDKDGVATGDTWEDTMYREPKNDIFTRAYIEWTGEPLTSNDVICIVRETQKDQPYSYPNNQKHIERALDNLSRQIQELQLTADNALKVDPSWNYTLDDTNKMDPIAWLQTIVRSKGKTLRELRIDNDYIEYTTDDPDSATKTWNVIAGVKTGNGGVISHIRETKVLAEDGVTYIPYLEYSVDGGNSWQPASMAGSEVTSLCVKKTGDTMSGPLNIINENGTEGALITLRNGTNETRTWRISASSTGPDLQFTYLASGITRGYAFVGNGIIPLTNNFTALGNNNHHWTKAYVNALNNGFDIAVPVTAEADTLALKSQVDLAANSGSQLRDKGVWYAKMDAATTPPSSAGVEGRNYADFTQVDQDNNPIIVIYTYTSGAWTQTETITPPASYNGYLPITSKFWDIQEQAGQQGGLVLWSYSAKTFTPYPRIISTDGIAITNSTFSNGSLTNVITTMPDSPVAKTVTNKQYVDNAITAALAGYDTPELFDWKWRDATTSKTTWKLSDGNWVTRASAATAYDHLLADYEDTRLYAWHTNSGGYNLYTKVRNPEAGTQLYESDGSASLYTVKSVRTGTSGESIEYIYVDVSEYQTDVEFYRQVAYDTHLAETETIAGTTITYYPGDDGHKIILPDQETNANTIYTATGVAWYYVFDGTNQRFKLPRTTPLTDLVKGNGTTLGLTNGTNNYGLKVSVAASNQALGVTTDAYGQPAGTASAQGGLDLYATLGVTTDATKSGIVVERATSDQYKYLYFYVGQ